MNENPCNMKRIRSDQLQTTTLLYLKKRNFTDSEVTFRQNLKFSSSPFEAASCLIKNNFVSSLDAVAMVTQNLDDYFLAFKSFCDFINNTVQRNYYPNLKQLICPVFVHVYMDLLNAGRINEAKDFFSLFSNEEVLKDDFDTIAHLQTIQSAADFLDNKLIKEVRNKVYLVSLSPEEKQLLVRFLYEQDNMVVMKILNDRFCLEEVENPHSSTSSNETSQEPTIRLSENKKSSASEDHVPIIISPPSSCPPVATPTTPQLHSIVDSFDIDKVVLKKHIAMVRSSQPDIQGLYMYKFKDDNDCITNASLSNNKELICTCRDDSSVSLWRLSSLRKGLFNHTNYHKTLDSLNEHFPDISTLKFGNEFLDDVQINAKNILEIRKKTLYENGVATLLGHNGPVYSSTFTHDDSFLLTSSEDTTIRVWDTQMLKNKALYQGHSYPVVSLCVSPLSFYFVSGSMDHTCRLWTLERTYPVRVFAGHEHSVESVAFHGNASYIASADNTIRLWDVNSGKTVRLFVGHWAPVTCLAFSPDGKYLASSGEDCRIRMWDIASGCLIKEIRSHTDTVYSLSFNLDSSLLVSCGADCSVCVWSTATSDSDTSLKTNLNEDHQWKFHDSVNKLFLAEFSGDILHCIGVV